MIEIEKVGVFGGLFFFFYSMCFLLYFYPPDFTEPFDCHSEFSLELETSEDIEIHHVHFIQSFKILLLGLEQFLSIICEFVRTNEAAQCMPSDLSP